MNPGTRHTIDAIDGPRIIVERQTDQYILSIVRDGRYETARLDQDQIELLIFTLMEDV